jgi:hypothetical protein
LRHQPGGKGGKACPEPVRVHAAAGQDFLVNEIAEGGADFQPMFFDPVQHDALLLLGNTATVERQAAGVKTKRPGC